MKRLLPMLLVALLLCGCGEADPREGARVQVSVLPGAHLRVEDNGQWVESGGDVTFAVAADEGYALTGVDYAGGYDLREGQGAVYLTLKDVRYPAKVRLTASPWAYRVTYFPNGGGGEPFTEYPSRELQPRPNTSVGTDRFTREGFTLVGWNTAPDGSGTAVGLGSRVTVEDSLTLYAQWAPWTPETDFAYRVDSGGAVITRYRGQAETVVLPETLGGAKLFAVAGGAFEGCGAERVICPKNLRHIWAEAFSGSDLTEIWLFDSIETVSDAAFSGCADLKTLHINAIEPPYGSRFRRESVYADKVDLLIRNQGRRKLVFYGGCSMWYNLDMAQVLPTFREQYVPVDLGLNGTVSSEAQLQIMAQFLERGDVLFHTPELSSPTQLMTETDMGRADVKLWCGIEYNYDLASLLDLRQLGGVFDSLYQYLTMKDASGGYAERYEDSAGRSYWGQYGEVPFSRAAPTGEELIDEVYLRPETLTASSLARLRDWYTRLDGMGVRVYVSYACVNLDALPEGDADKTAAADEALRAALDGAPATVVSTLEDYLYHNSDFYDTNYHMLSASAAENTRRWLRDLTAVMEADGIWEAP